MVHKTLHRNYGLSNTDLAKLRNFGCELMLKMETSIKVIMIGRTIVSDEDIYSKCRSLESYYHWVDTSDGGLLLPYGITLPVVSVSALTWFIRYMCPLNLQFL